MKLFFDIRVHTILQCWFSNIDSRIRQAETEYQLEREETNLLNLQDEKRTLLLRYGGNLWQHNLVPSNARNSLFR